MKNLVIEMKTLLNSIFWTGIRISKFKDRLIKLIHLKNREVPKFDERLIYTFKKLNKLQVG